MEHKRCRYRDSIVPDNTQRVFHEFPSLMVKRTYPARGDACYKLSNVNDIRIYLAKVSRVIFDAVNGISRLLA
jgi:hypothetical protein